MSTRSWRQARTPGSRRRSAGCPPCRRRLATRPRPKHSRCSVPRTRSIPASPTFGGGREAGTSAASSRGSAAPALRLPGAAAHAGRAAGRVARRGWDRVVAFQTCNPMHRALERRKGLGIDAAFSSTSWSAIPGRATSTTKHQSAVLLAVMPSLPAGRPRMLSSKLPAMRMAGPCEAVARHHPQEPRGRTTSSSVAIMPDLAWTGPAGRSTTCTRPRTFLAGTRPNWGSDPAVPADGLCGGRRRLPAGGRGSPWSLDARHLGHQAAAPARSGPSASPGSRRPRSPASCVAAVPPGPSRV